MASGRFHPVEKPGGIRHTVDQPLPNLIPAEPFRLGPSQNSEHVVLSSGDSVGLQDFLEIVSQDIGGPLNVQLRLLVKARERLVLFELLDEFSLHGANYRCYNIYCQDVDF